MPAPRVSRWLLAAALLSAPLSASATPVVFNFTSGQVTVTATLLPTSGPPQTIQLNGNTSVTVALTGTSVTFDSALVPGNALPSFSLVTSPIGPLTLSPAVGTITTVALSALSIVPGSLYSSSVTGSNPYNFNAGPIKVSGSISLNGGAFSSFNNNNNTSVTGQVNLGVGELDLNGISLWQTNIPGTGTLLIKGDLQFHGVPEPGLAILIACAGAALAARTRRQ